MRNLKKILALVLALMMVLSVMVTASASFDDAADIDYAEAVEVMVAAGVLSGDGTGNFNPDKDLERSSAAKLIAYVQLQSNINVLTKVDTQFSDVTASHWASGYIAFCAGRGYVVGDGTGKYNPNAPINGYSFAKMLLLALGVEDTLAGEDEAPYTGSDWAIKVALSMSGTPLRAGLPTDINLNNNLTREQAAQMTFNALTWDKDGVGAGVSILENSFGITKVPANELGVDKYGVSETTKWVNEDTDVVYVTYATEKATVYGGEGYALPEKYTIAQDAELYYNGKNDVDGWDVTDLAKSGVVSKLYGTADRQGNVTITKVVSTEYYFATVAVDDDKNITLTIEEATYTANHEYAYDSTKTDDQQSAGYKALASYADGTALAVCVNPQGWGETATLQILDIAEVTALTGTVTATAHTNYNGYIRIDGEKYTFANEYNQATVGLGTKTGTFYLYNGLILGYVAPAGQTPVGDTEEVFVYQIGNHVEKIAGTETVYDKYGNVVTEGTDDVWVKIAQVVTLDGTVDEIIVDKFDSDPEYTATPYNRLIKITGYDEETGITSITVLADQRETAKQVNIPATGIKVNTNYYLTSANYINVIGRQDKVEVVPGTQAGAAAATGTSYIVFGEADDNGNYTVETVIYWTDPEAPVVETPSYDEVLYATGAAYGETSSVLKEGEENATNVYSYEVYVGSEKQTVLSYETSLSGLYKFYVDAYGVTVVDALDSNDGVVSTTVENVYGALVSFTGSVQDYDVTNTVIVDLTEAADENDTKGGNGKLDVNESVVYILGGTQTAPLIELVYIVG